MFQIRGLCLDVDKLESKGWSSSRLQTLSVEVMFMTACQCKRAGCDTDYC